MYTYKKILDLMLLRERRDSLLPREEGASKSSPEQPETRNYRMQLFHLKFACEAQQKGNTAPRRRGHAQTDALASGRFSIMLLVSFLAQCVCSLALWEEGVQSVLRFEGSGGNSSNASHSHLGFSRSFAVMSAAYRRPLMLFANANDI
ncbi:hypothetical protein Baya_5757 [Bagarius yarrelli]|uniref:Uncharacterized protein n=1 Tax=Bagarius yarrelli TaxID=175774 RepID=A0A556TYE2_BAGYA|nr:hypothetical protein Baya_5757 [Bagarius yarrelli]